MPSPASAALGRQQLAELELRDRARRRCRSGRACARRARSAPRTTIAALGPPMPVDCTVSSSPSAAVPRVAPESARVVEHPRRFEQRLGHRQRAVRIAGQQHPLGQLGRAGSRWIGRLRAGAPAADDMGDCAAMAKAKPTPSGSATPCATRSSARSRRRVGSAQPDARARAGRRGRDRPRRRGRRRVACATRVPEAIDARRPATYEDINASCRRSCARSAAGSTRSRSACRQQAPQAAPAKPKPRPGEAAVQARR